ncbi:hypothetical protein GVX81_02670 [[Haemophilus] felis]|uniref:Protein CopB n=1 Tax=[Haemophilus] felis TaxID=123822 RepID=A0A1T0B212_9PAST|nr:hypothetical protein [[Haemophilus] felis]NBI40209.1 hypothetical protein [[Haemophilus] felis]OOS04124.1 hypothetical protein B0188_05510 [[Haemophilus] felis]
MANAMTEHSKQLRAKTAAEWKRKQRELGLAKQFSVTLETAVCDELNAILAEIGGTKAQAIKRLCELYRRQVS